MAEKYEDLHREMFKEHAIVADTFSDGALLALRWLDEHPDAVPLRKIPVEESDERVTGWNWLASHPAFQSCYSEERPLIHAISDRLTQLLETEMTVNELAPAEVPERPMTITESELEGAARAVSSTEYQIEARGEYFRRALDHLGIEVVPDPEPTNAERLAAIIAEKFQREYRGDQNDALGIGKYLDEAGVKAPGGGDGE